MERAPSRQVHREIHAPGWMSSGGYLATAAKALAEKVQAPLRARGIAVQESALA
jgi:hypothetical protein